MNVCMHRWRESVMVVGREMQLYQTSGVLQVRKAGKASLEEVGNQVWVDAKETEAVMVLQDEMDRQAVPDFKDCLVPVESLVGVEDLERTACLVYQAPTAHLVTRAVMEVGVLLDGLV